MSVMLYRYAAVDLNVFYCGSPGRPEAIRHRPLIDLLPSGASQRLEIVFGSPVEITSTPEFLLAVTLLMTF